MSKDAGPQDIKVAYLSKAREYHPDKRPECLEYFTHVTNAYDTLNDPHKRAIYDDESIPDEDYFTVYVGSQKINLFTVFTVGTFFGAGLLIYAKFFSKSAETTEGKCPIEHSRRNEFAEIAREKYKSKDNRS